MSGGGSETVPKRKSPMEIGPIFLLFLSLEALPDSKTVSSTRVSSLRTVLK
jgi:hypothetical protein